MGIFSVGNIGNLKLPLGVGMRRLKPTEGKLRDGNGSRRPAQLGILKFPLGILTASDSANGNVSVGNGSLMLGNRNLHRLMQSNDSGPWDCYGWTA